MIQRSLWLKLVIILVATFVIGVVCAKGEVNVRFIHAWGPESLPRATVAALSRQVVEELRNETGVDIRYKGLVFRRNPFPRLINTCNFDSTESVVHSWYWRLFGTARFKGLSTVHVVMPPLVCNGEKYTSGWATRCMFPSVSVSFTTERNSKGLYRVPHAYVAMKHEVAHILGAPDLEPAVENWGRIMNTGALQFSRIPWPLDPKDVRAIRQCIRRG